MEPADDRQAKAKDAAERLDAFAAEQDWSTCQEELEDHFTLTKVADGRIWILSTIEKIRIGPIEVPKEVTDLLEEGWGIAGVLGRARKQWQFVEVFKVFPG